MPSTCLPALAVLTVAYAAHAGLIERPSGPDENLNRFVFNDGALAISRPDESWKFEVDVSEPPVVARMSSPDAAAVVDVQVQHVPGATLDQVKEPIEQAIAAEAQDFNKLSGRDVDVNGIAAYELTFTITREGTPHKAKMLVYKPGDTLYVVNCNSSAEQWKRFEPDCDTVLASFELLPPEQGKRWGRRIEWEAEAGPEGREHASFILDPSRDRAVMLLGSGYQPYLDPLADAWAYDLNEDRWSELQLEGDTITPGGSRRAARVEGGAFLHGGYGKDMSASRDLWELRFEDTRIEITLVEQENAPEPRLLHGFAADTKGERFVIFGGGSTTGVLDDTWIGTKSGKGVSWHKLDLDVNPGPRYGFSFAHDEENGLLIVCGGQIPSSAGSEVDEFALDSWTLDFTAKEPEWTLLAEYEPREFPGRRNPAFTFDQRSGDLFVWGGAGDGESVIPDLFIVQTREDEAPVQRVSQSASIPTRASGFGVVDPKRSRTLMGFGNIGYGPFLDLVEVQLRPMTPPKPLYPVEACRLSEKAFTGVGLGFPRSTDRLKSTGKVTAVVLFADFPDVAAIMTAEQVMDILSPTAPDFYGDVSYGRMDLVLTPHLEWLRMGKPSSSYAGAIRQFASHRDWLQETMDLADAKVDFAGADVVVVVATPNATEIGYGPTWMGFEGNGGTLAADGAKIKNGITSGADLLHWGGIWLNHEMGHSMSLADLYAYDGPMGFTRPFSLMDLISSEAPEYLAYERWFLGWLDDAQIVCLSASEEVSLVAIEVKDGIKAAMVPLNANRAVVVESRRALGWDAKLGREGAVVYVVDTTIKSGSGPIRVINDGNALLPGESVTVEGVRIEVTAANSAGDTVRVTIK